jgi:hypothetical protein
MTFVLGNILTVKFNQYGQLVIAIISVTLSILVVTGVL